MSTMGILKRLGTLGRDQGGNALAICAAAMPLVIGGAGLAIDSVQISVARRELQRAADSAALAGAYAINQNPSSTGSTRTTFAQNGAVRDLEVNNDVTLSGAAVVQNAPATGPFATNANAVRVQLTANRTMSFLSFFDATPVAITVEATAAIVREGSFCMLALEDGNATGVSVGGNATINIGCGISSNSTSPNAITASGSSSVTASPIMAVGGVPSSSNFASGTTLIPFAPVQSDPFANLPTPSPSNCVNAPASGSKSNVTVTTSTPGYTAATNSFCFNGWDIKGNVTLDFAQPTIVYINGGELGFGAQAHVTARNVVFVLTSTNATSNPNSIATLGMNGGAELDIESPSSGPFDGVAIYEDRRAPLGRTTRFNGGSGSIINGALYMPQAYFEYNGNADMDAQCIQLVARRLDFRGNGSVTNQCDSADPSQNFQATYVRLVG
ncbi:MAG TPA: pilus assembly protein TadG-related protein [Allosphingosinicella sp.]|jgi:Flp pilus assembly protein TadG